VELTRTTTDVVVSQTEYTLRASEGAPWARLEDDGRTLITEVRVDRRSLVSGLFYGVEGMRIGGTRRLEIAPHLAYGDRGVPGVIPSNAVLTAEITVLAPDVPAN